MEDQKDGFPLCGAVQTSKDGFLLMVLLGGSVYLKGGAWLGPWGQVLEGGIWGLWPFCVSLLPGCHVENEPPL